MKECCKVCIKKEVSCPVKECEHWLDYEGDKNCALIAIENHGRMTLREVADRMKVSFVRIKQIEDRALKKLTESNLNMKNYLFYGRD